MTQNGRTTMVTEYVDKNGEIIGGEPVVKGENLALYLYGADGYHSGKQWFTSGAIRWPDEQVTAAEAKKRADRQMAKGLEVRVCNGGDWIVFHADGDKVLYPVGLTAEEFWGRV